MATNSHPTDASSPRRDVLGNRRDVAPSCAVVGEYLADLQNRLCDAFERIEPVARFDRRELHAESRRTARPRVLSDGTVLEKAAVQFSHTCGERLPAAASARRPDLEGSSYEAASVSLIVHPRNPYAPTCHMNLRVFFAYPEDTGAEARWWFGGGFDLTPYYGFTEDARHWHRTAFTACTPFGAECYPRFKRWCDEYFYLPHREEARGIGGLFFDDLSDLDAGEVRTSGHRTGHGTTVPSSERFGRCFAFLRSVGEHFMPAYLPILERRKEHPFGERERAFQLLRRGRYVEFNLLFDRGTRFGLQSSSRVESVLASLPNLAAWRYDFQPEPGSTEARLVEEFLRPRDWLGQEGWPAEGGVV